MKHEPSASGDCEERVRRVIEALWRDTDVRALAMDEDLIGRLGFDSQELLALILKLEEEFQISINESELRLEDVQSLRGLTSLVAEALRLRPGGHRH